MAFRFRHSDFIELTFASRVSGGPDGVSTRTHEVEKESRRDLPKLRGTDEAMRGSRHARGKR